MGEEENIGFDCHCIPWRSYEGKYAKIGDGAIAGFRRSLIRRSTTLPQEVATPRDVSTHLEKLSPWAHTLGWKPQPPGSC